MALRPFWIDANIEGRENNLVGGPRAKEGQMSIDLKVRDKGTSKKAYTINCYSENGKLKIDIRDSNGEIVHSTESDY